MFLSPTIPFLIHTYKHTQIHASQLNIITNKLKIPTQNGVLDITGLGKKFPLYTLTQDKSLNKVNSTLFYIYRI